tara:strand:- start:291 stop:650 length:360 start_codon:yes stop_codon:yes gene_type:complete
MTSTEVSKDIIKDIKFTFKQLREEKFYRPEKLEHLLNHYNNYKNCLSVLPKPEQFYLNIIDNKLIFNNILKYISRFIIEDNISTDNITSKYLFKLLLYVCWKSELNDMMKSINMKVKLF